MPLVRSCDRLEDWLRTSGLAWRLVSDDQYRELVSTWRETFEWMFESNAGHLWSNRAVRALDSCLPADIIIFNVPGYAHIPAGSRQAPPPFAYAVEQARALDHDLLNYAEAVVAAQDLTFTCLYSHEAGKLSDAPLFFSVDRAGVRPA